MSTKYSPNTYNSRKYVAGRRAILRSYTFLNASISNNKIGSIFDTFNDIKQRRFRMRSAMGLSHVLFRVTFLKNVVALCDAIYCLLICSISLFLGGLLTVWDRTQTVLHRVVSCLPNWL